MAVNPRGIPKSPFIQDVAEYVASEGIESCLSSLQELLRKYQFMQSSVLSRQQNMAAKVKELSETLDIIELRQKSTSAELSFDFELDDTLYATGSALQDARLCLWLGANTMLMYEPDEALKLLRGKKETAQRSKEAASEDLAWLQEQVTVTQVNIARVYNWDVRRRRATKNAV